MNIENLFGEAVFIYTRAQAIEDGVLVDLSHVDSIQQHWKFPFACTSTVWAIIEAAPNLSIVLQSYSSERLAFELAEGIGSRHRDMPQIQFTSDEIASIQSYLSGE